MWVLFLIPASYFMRILLGGDICFMGYIGSVGYDGLYGSEYHIVFGLLGSYNSRNLSDP